MNHSDFYVCTDCLMAIANNDFTGLDYYYDEVESEEIMETIIEGMSKLGAIYPGDPDNDREFSSIACDCCGTRLAGNRHHCVRLDD